MKKLPIYELDIKEGDEESQEVNYVALVDEPAINRHWMAFNENKQLFQADKERRIISGALMVADLPIYRRDEVRGEYYVVFKKEAIMKIVQKFFRKGYTSNVNKMHSEDAKVDGVYMFESFVIDESRGIKAPIGFDGLSEGSWFGSFKVDNEQLWNEFIKTGVFTGFSVEGVFEMLPEGEKSEKEIDRLVKSIDKI